jgi:hypothetical protein
VDAIRRDGDVDWAVGFFVEIGAFRLVIVTGRIGIGKVHVASSEDLESVVKVGSGSQVLRAEAGAGIVHFQQNERLAGVIADGCLNVGGVASGDDEKADEKSENAEVTHGLSVTGWVQSS